MIRTPPDDDIEVYTLDICCKLPTDELCPGITILRVGYVELGPVACSCGCHLRPETNTAQ